MEAACFSPSSLALLGVIATALQAVIVTLFWLVIRSKDDSIADAQRLRDRALDINEEAIRAGGAAVTTTERVLSTRRGKA